MSDLALTIVRLEVSNVKRIRAVTIEPAGSAVILGGLNAQGKTSVLDAIEIALGGARSMPEDPVRHGAKKAHVIADLGELVVERTISKTGTSLVVRNRDGERLASPQAILDKLCSRIAFDPLDFYREQPTKQNEILRRLVGLDFTASDSKRQALYDERTRVNREAKAARAQSESLVVPPGTPDEPVSVADLVAQIGAAHAAKSAKESHARSIADAKAKVELANHDLAAAEEAARRAEAAVIKARLVKKHAHAALDELASKPAPPEPGDVSQLEAQVKNAETTNRNVDRKKRRDAHEDAANQLETEAAELSQQIEAIDAAQSAQLAAAKYPVEGLALGTTGPTFRGVPLEQASGAERLRVSVAIGLALNPRLRVLLVRDASLLDENSLRLVASMAAEAGAQVWLERVGTGDPGAVIIQDGQIAEAGQAAE